MWMLFPALSVAILHIAGDNLIVVPDIAVTIGSNILITIFLAYIVGGGIVSGISAWIGVKTGQELSIVIGKIFGCRGKKILAIAILMISIPASSLTGGHFCGWILQGFWGFPQYLTAFLALFLFACFAAGWGEEILHCSNYCAILFIPMTMLMFGLMSPTAAPTIAEIRHQDINWPLVFALISYNSGGMRPPLIVETATYLSKRKMQGVFLAILAKTTEGLFTLMLAYLILEAEVQGPLALSQAAAKVFGNSGGLIYNALLFCTLTNTMVPAMKVNGRQILTLTGLPFPYSLAIAVTFVYLVNFCDVTVLLQFMASTGIIMFILIALTAYYIYKSGNNKQ